MIDLEQLVEVQINRSNRKGYRNQGFDCDMGDIIQVKMKNLYRPANSIRIKVICENCGKEYSMLWSNYQTLLKQDDKRPFCKDCASIKEKEVLEEGQSISYLGSGTFGVCQKSEDGKYTIVKRIEVENKDDSLKMKNYVEGLKA